jgi:hypothetical protein
VSTGYRGIAFRVVCPTCSAQVGSYCVGVKGQPLRRPHRGRASALPRPYVIRELIVDRNKPYPEKPEDPWHIESAHVVSRHETKDQALLAGRRIAGRDIFRGPVNVIEITGPDIAEPERYVRAGSVSSRGNTISINGRRGPLLRSRRPIHIKGEEVSGGA